MTLGVLMSPKWVVALEACVGHRFSGGIAYTHFINLGLLDAMLRFSCKRSEFHFELSKIADKLQKDSNYKAA